MGTKTPLFVRRAVGGMFTVVDERLGSGNIYWVHNTGTDSPGNGSNPDSPLATIDYAIGLCTANQGDVIYVLPGHEETVTSAITCDVAGVSIVGIGEGLLRPKVTGNGTIDVFNVTAANVRIENIQFPAPETDNQTSDINIAAAGCVVRNTYHIGSQTAKNKTDIITITAAGNDFLIDGVRVYNTTVDCVSAISIEGACARGEIRNCNIQGTFSTAALMDEDTATLLYIHDCIFKNTKAGVACVSFSNNSTGVTSKCFISGRHTTLASNFATGTGMDCHETRVVEEAGVNGAVIPVADTD